MNDDTAARVTEAMGFLVEAVEEIAPENWYRPSNLEGWEIPELVAHVTGSAAKLVTLVEGGDGQEASQPDDLEYADRATQLRELADELQTALAEADLDAIDAFLGGYESVRPLTPAEGAALPAEIHRFAPVLRDAGLLQT